MHTQASIVLEYTHNSGTERSYFRWHSNGCPDGIDATLQEFVKSDIAERCWRDIQYLGAALVIFCNNSEYLLPDVVPVSRVSAFEECEYTIQYTINVNTLELSVQNTGRYCPITRKD